MLFHSDLEMSSFFRHSKCQKSRLIRGIAEEGEEAFSRGSTCERTNKMLNRYMAQWRKKAQRPCKVFSLLSHPASFPDPFLLLNCIFYSRSFYC